VAERTRQPFVSAPGIEPWERQPGESDHAWQAFVHYRDSGLERSLRKTSEALGKSKHGVLERWSVRWGWRIRVEAHDRERDRQRRDAATQAERDAVRDMVQRHTRIAETIQRAATVELARLVRQLGADSPTPNLQAPPTLTPDQLQRLLDYALKLERLNRGEPETVSETRGTGVPWAELVRLSKEVAR
jgi:hypothetical protein